MLETWEELEETGTEVSADAPRERVRDDADEDSLAVRRVLGGLGGDELREGLRIARLQPLWKYSALLWLLLTRIAHLQPQRRVHEKRSRRRHFGVERRRSRDQSRPLRMDECQAFRFARDPAGTCRRVFFVEQLEEHAESGENVEVVNVVLANPRTHPIHKYKLVPSAKMRFDAAR